MNHTLPTSNSPSPEPHPSHLQLTFTWTTPFIAPTHLHMTHSLHSSNSPSPEPQPSQLQLTFTWPTAFTAQTHLHLNHSLPTSNSPSPSPQLKLTFAVLHITHSLDPSLWVTKIQNEFARHAVPKDSKIRNFVSSLEGKLYHWVTGHRNAVIVRREQTNCQPLPACISHYIHLSYCDSSIKWIPP